MNFEEYIQPMLDDYKENILTKACVDVFDNFLKTCDLFTEKDIYKYVKTEDEFQRFCRLFEKRAP